jgi:hypothetical protein
MHLLLEVFDVCPESGYVPHVNPNIARRYEALSEEALSTLLSQFPDVLLHSDWESDDGGQAVVMMVMALRQITHGVIQATDHELDIWARNLTVMMPQEGLRRLHYVEIDDFPGPTSGLWREDLSFHQRMGWAAPTLESTLAEVKRRGLDFPV